MAEFHGGLSFSGARFREAAELTASNVYNDVLNLTNVTFDTPDRVVLRSLNTGPHCGGLKLAAINCNIECVRFEEVTWYREHGRLVLEDERDILSEWTAPVSPALVLVAYRRLMISFDSSRAYDLAEECFRAQLEMRAAHSEVDTVSRLTIKIYGLASVYGSSYKRAAIVLATIVLLLFPLAFWAVDSSLAGTGVAGQEGWLTKGPPAAFYCSIEAASFASQTLCQLTNPAGHVFRLLERIIVPAQGALLLLALRRRLKRE